MLSTSRRKTAPAPQTSSAPKVTSVLQRTCLLLPAGGTCQPGPLTLLPLRCLGCTGNLISDCKQDWSTEDRRGFLSQTCLLCSQFVSQLKGYFLWKVSCCRTAGVDTVLSRVERAEGMQNPQAGQTPQGTPLSSLQACLLHCYGLLGLLHSIVRAG